jgi:hypothetical protein
VTITYRDAIGLIAEVKKPIWSSLNTSKILPNMHISQSTYVPTVRQSPPKLNNMKRGEVIVIDEEEEPKSKQAKKSSSDPRTWTIDEVAAWIEQQQQFAQYASNFRTNFIDGSVLVTLTDQDLKDIEIPALGHRKQILHNISELAVKPAK